MRVTKPRRETAEIGTVPAGIGPRIRYYRRAHNWTVEELAARIGVDETYLNALENGYWEPSAELTAVLADTFHVTLSELKS